MRALAVCADTKAMTLDEVRDKIVAITLLFEDVLSSSDSMTPERIDFLVFMQAKHVAINGVTQLVEGETLFKQWKDARETASKMKPVPKEDCDPSSKL